MDPGRRWKGSALPLDYPTRPALAPLVIVELTPMPATCHAAASAPLDLIPRRFA